MHKSKIILFALLAVVSSVFAQDEITLSKAQYEDLLRRIERLEAAEKVDATTGASPQKPDTASTEKSKKERKHLSREAGGFTIGGYGEAVLTRNFYSDNINRYSKAAQYKDAVSNGQIDLPHVVLMLGYDFGRGWSFGSEIEFEHGGTESAVEMEDEEFGEWEKEIERGGEVALEQFWIQKSFGDAINIRLGHDVVPVGYTNAHHLPTEFFTVYRPEGENQILPCTWHQTGISIWGRTKHMRYQIMGLPGLNSHYFSKDSWIKYGSASSFEFTPANKYAAAARFDFYPVDGLRLGVSGYYGHSFNNTLQSDESGKYKNVKGAVGIGTIDFEYKCRYARIQGNADYGHLSDAEIISSYNRMQSSTSPYTRTLVGDQAWCASLQAGLDVFSFSDKLFERNQRLFVFAAYEYYDAYNPAGSNSDYKWTERHRLAVGVNYYPLKDVVIKAEFSERFLHEQYNNEPSISLGVCYAGFFNLDRKAKRNN